MARISDLDKITDPNDSNVFPISDGLTTKKITYLDLKTAITSQATNNRLGTVKVGNGLLIDETGTLSVQNFQGYTLPPATTNQLGGVIIGSGLTVNDVGVLSSTFNLQTASPTVLGGIKVGEGLTISNGILSVIPVETDTFGDAGIIIGNESDFRFYVENSNTPTIKDDVNGVIVISVKDTSMAGNLADIRLLARNMTVGQGDETAPALVPDFSGQPMNLGTPSLKWSKVYANNFIGNVTGTASKSTEADSLLVGAAYFSASTSPITDTIVARDSIGNVNAINFIGNLTGNVTGNAATASRLETTRTINGQPFNGTQDIVVTSVSPFAITRGAYLIGGAASYDGSFPSTWSVNATANATPNTVVARDSAGDFQATSIVATNFVGNVTGNVTGNVIGNASTASRLITSRKINGVDFDGSQDIQLPANPARVDELAGSIKMWGSPTPPANWLLCNGQSVSRFTYPTLFSRIGYSYGGSGSFFNLPNLTNRFPVGAGGLYGTNATGGSKDATVPSHSHATSTTSTFTGNTLPNHSHTFTGNALPLHSHGVIDPGHTHGLAFAGNPDLFSSALNAAYRAAPNGNARPFDWTDFSNIRIRDQSAGTPSGTINSVSSGVPSGTVNTTVEVLSSGTSGTNANLPPYIAVYYIIKASDDGSGGGTLQAGTGIDIQTSGPFSVISSTVNTDNFLPRTGGALSGFLNLHSNPTISTHAANKAYVDQKFDSVVTLDNTKLPLTGGALTGPLFLNANPVAALQAATKAYVDSLIDLTPDASGGEYAGTIKLWSGSTPPDSTYAFCDGATVSRTQYATLFSRIGTTYGAGNGSTTFRLPDFRGKTAVGAGTGYSRGSTGGFDSAPIGTVMAYTASGDIPSGYLLCNGASYSRTEYADLFAIIGTTYGGSNSQNTFRVPDYRAMFLRGLDEGRGIDPQRTLRPQFQKGTLQWSDSGSSPGSAPGDVGIFAKTSGVTNLNGDANFGSTNKNIGMDSYGAVSHLYQPDWVANEFPGFPSLNTPSALTTTIIGGTSNYSVYSNPATAGWNQQLPDGYYHHDMLWGITRPHNQAVRYIIKAWNNVSGSGVNYTSAHYIIKLTDTGFSTGQLEQGDNVTLTVMPSGATRITANPSVIDNSKLPLTGGALSGPLLLSGNPTQSLQAATKNYVDTQLASVQLGRVRQIKTKTIGYGSQTYWSGGINGYQTGGKDAQAIQTILSTTPQIVRAPFNNILEVEINPLSLDSLFKIDCTVACTGTYVTHFQIRKSINGGPFNTTVNHDGVTNTGYNGAGADPTFGHGVKNSNHTHFVRTTTAEYIENVNFTFIDPVLPQVGQTIRYRLYACSSWANQAWTLIINNRAPHYDMPNYSTMTVTEFLP